MKNAPHGWDTYTEWFMGRDERFEQMEVRAGILTRFGKAKAFKAVHVC